MFFQSADWKSCIADSINNVEWTIAALSQSSVGVMAITNSGIDFKARISPLVPHYQIYVRNSLAFPRKAINFDGRRLGELSRWN